MIGIDQQIREQEHQEDLARPRGLRPIQKELQLCVKLLKKPEEQEK